MLCKVTLYRNDGTDSRMVLPRKKKEAIGALPEPKWSGHVFLGWFDDAELGHGRKYKPDTLLTSKVKLYAHWMPVKRKAAMYDINHQDSTWVNDAKNQTSLEMGTAAYEEYLEDLREHDPFRPDDDMHEELEMYNELIAERIREKSDLVRKADSFDKQKIRMEHRKQEKVRTERQRLEKEVKATPSKEDDRRLAAMKTGSYIHSDGVSLQGLDETMRDFVYSK